MSFLDVMSTGLLNPFFAAVVITLGKSLYLTMSSFDLSMADKYLYRP